jgi:hypothetical protein
VCYGCHQPEGNSAAPSGLTIVAQVWAKRLPAGAVAVLFLNADTNKTQSLSVRRRPLAASLHSPIPASYDPYNMMMRMIV